MVFLQHFVSAAPWAPADSGVASACCFCRAEFSRFIHLRYLDVSGNDLSGSALPYSWMDSNHPLASQLQMLMLHDNHFNGTLPLGVSLGMPNLEVLDGLLNAASFLSAICVRNHDISEARSYTTTDHCCRFLCLVVCSAGPWR